MQSHLVYSPMRSKNRGESPRACRRLHSLKDQIHAESKPTFPQVIGPGSATHHVGFTPDTRYEALRTQESQLS